MNSSAIQSDRDKSRDANLMTPSQPLASQTAAITEVLAKLERAESGSRELDAEIALHFGYRIDRNYKVPFWCAPDGWSPLPRGFSDLPGFSTSVDAALALIAKALPGWSTALNIFPGGAGAVLCRDFEAINPALIEGEATRPALALCIALLKALAGRSASDDHQTPDEATRSEASEGTSS